MRDKQLEEAILALNKKKLEEYLDKLSGSKEDSACDNCTAYPFYERGKTPLCKTCKDNPNK